ncbi:thiamine pyrophosphate-binding protein [Telmatospirillum sp. J64-1]|uniref:thiamine pyrophosphate-binding protein n=1 Tax=Telmatospirillum sp. J64-1 TaxID=2502183 RepID=UPI00115EEA01|nr:thiamine pyrophosphate-binding protein [Telmatospirillum sp. J64-1]
MRGADLVAETLARAGTKVIFTLSGNQIMPIFDACIDQGIQLVHVRHEAAAVYMADAWAQLTGQVGVALLTAAPGFTNGLAPLYSARQSESPILLISGDSPVGQDGSGAFQELDQAAISRPLTKLARRTLRADRLGHDVAEALRVARSGRPGPVHLAIPFDVVNETVSPDAIPAADACARDLAPLDPAIAKDIAKALASAERPVVLTGPMMNATRASAMLSALADGIDAPVVPMESPRGLRDPSLGAFVEVLSKADLVLCLGKIVDFTVGFGRPPGFAADSRIIVLDPEADAIARARRLFGARLMMAARADVDLAAGALCEATGGSRARAAWRAEVAEAIAYRDLPPSGVAGISPQDICKAAQALLDQAEEPILIADGGEFGQWAQAFVTAPKRIINGMSGAIGGGLCYAIAAKLAHPKATVVALMGDGTAGFHFSEFDTAIRADAPFLAIIGNDSRWNAEHVIQMREYGEDRLIGCQLNPAARYDLAAAGFGCHGEMVEAPEGLDGALARAAASDLPACINVRMEGLPAPVFTRTGIVAASGH